MKAAKPQRSDAEYKQLGRKFFAHCKGSLDISKPECFCCCSLADCLDEERK